MLLSKELTLTLALTLTLTPTLTSGAPLRRAQGGRRGRTPAAPGLQSDGHDRQVLSYLGQRGRRRGRGETLTLTLTLTLSLTLTLTLTLTR